MDDVIEAFIEGRQVDAKRYVHVTLHAGLGEGSARRGGLIGTLHFLSDIVSVGVLGRTVRPTGVKLYRIVAAGHLDDFPFGRLHHEGLIVDPLWFRAEYPLFLLRNKRPQLLELLPHSFNGPPVGFRQRSENGL